MSLVDTDEAVFSASYKVIRIHAYALPDQPGTSDALAAASGSHVASSDFAIIVVCAEDLLKVQPGGRQSLSSAGRSSWSGAEGVGFEPTETRNASPVFKTGAIGH